MDPSVSGPALAALGEDLFVLSIRPRDGKLLTRGRIDSALMASELVRLAAAGRAQIAAGRIAVRDRAPAGDAELDSALLSLTGAAFPPRPETWVGLSRPGIREVLGAHDRGGHGPGSHGGDGNHHGAHGDGGHGDGGHWTIGGFGHH